MTVLKLINFVKFLFFDKYKCEILKHWCTTGNDETILVSCFIRFLVTIIRTEKVWQRCLNLRRDSGRSFLYRKSRCSLGSSGTWTTTTGGIWFTVARTKRGAQRECTSSVTGKGVPERETSSVTDKEVPERVYQFCNRQGGTKEGNCSVAGKGLPERVLLFCNR